METIFFILFKVVFISIGIFGAYMLLKHVYGDNDPRKWKPQVFTKDVTFKSVFHTNQKKEKESSDDN